MSAFALASVVGVPFGLYVGMRFDWHVPFLLLAALGCPVLVVAAKVLPPLRDHVGRSAPIHPLRSLAETFTEANHLNAFALVVTMMFGGFAVIVEPEPLPGRQRRHAQVQTAAGSTSPAAS